MTDGELIFLIEWGERMRRQGDQNVGPLLDSRDIQALRFYVLAFLVATERRVGPGAAGFPIEHPDGRGVEGALIMCLADQLIAASDREEAARIRAMSFAEKQVRVAKIFDQAVGARRELVH